MQTLTIPAGSTSQSVFIEMIDIGTGLPAPGLTYDFPVYVVWNRTGAALDGAAAAELPLQTTAWTSAGVIEVGYGVYRVDVPNAALASGVDRVVVGLVDNISPGSVLNGGYVQIQLANVTTDLSGSALRRVAAR